MSSTSTNKPLIIEPALPVFTNLTDQVDVSAVLHNNTNSAQEIEVTVTLDEHAVFVSQIGEKLTTNSGPAPLETERSVKAMQCGRSVPFGAGPPDHRPLE